MAACCALAIRWTVTLRGGRPRCRRPRLLPLGRKRRGLGLGGGWHRGATRETAAATLIVSPARTRWDVVALAFAAGYMVGMQVGKVPPALPMLEAELGLPRVIAGADRVVLLRHGRGPGRHRRAAGRPAGHQTDGFRRGCRDGAREPRRRICGERGTAARGPHRRGLRLRHAHCCAGPRCSSPRPMAPCAASSSASGAPTCRSASRSRWVIATVLLEPLGWRALWFINTGLILLFLLAFAWGAAPGRLSMPAAGSTFDRAGVRVTLARPGPWLFGLCFAIFAVQWQALMAWATHLPDRDPGPLARRCRTLHRALRPCHHRGLRGQRLAHAPGRRALAALGAYLHGHGRLRGDALRTPSRPLPPRSRSPYASPWPAARCPPRASKAASRTAPSQAQVAMAGGFVAQGARARRRARPRRCSPR